MSNVIEDYFEKQLKKQKRGGLNLPAMARKATEFMDCITSDLGMLFVSEDVVALEPSITAEMSKDPMYQYATLTGIGQKPYYKGDVLMIDDIYLMSASQFPPTKNKMKEIFDTATFEGKSFAEQWLADSEVCKDYCKKPVRNFAKTACLGIGYGMGWKKFKREAEDNGTVLTPAEAKGTIDAYWTLFQGLKRLRDSLSWTVKKTGSIENQFGYRNTPEAHKAMNAYIQSSASGVLDVYTYKLFQMAPYLKFVTLVHDEVIYQCPENMLDQLKIDSEIAVKSLNNDLGWSVPIRFGTKTAKSFAGVK